MAEIVTPEVLAQSKKLHDALDKANRELAAVPGEFAAGKIDKAGWSARIDALVEAERAMMAWHYRYVERL